jgi:hypothetical protein
MLKEWRNVLLYKWFSLVPIVEILKKFLRIKYTPKKNKYFCALNQRTLN